MDIVSALKQFFAKLNGTTPSGSTIADVIKSAIAGTNTVNYRDATNKSIVLASSTAASTKKFVISVTDDGVISATLLA